MKATIILKPGEGRSYTTPSGRTFLSGIAETLSSPRDIAEVQHNSRFSVAMVDDRGIAKPIVSTPKVRAVVVQSVSEEIPKEQPTEEPTPEDEFPEDHYVEPNDDASSGGEEVAPPKPIASPVKPAATKPKPIPGKPAIPKTKV